jgi:hypothetical protein
VELSVVEQRYRAVLAVLAGESVTTVAAKDRRLVHELGRVDTAPVLSASTVYRTEGQTRASPVGRRIGRAAPASSKTPPDTDGRRAELGGPAAGPDLRRGGVDGRVAGHEGRQGEREAVRNAERFRTSLTLSKVEFDACPRDASAASRPVIADHDKARVLTREPNSRARDEPDGTSWTVPGEGTARHRAGHVVVDGPAQSPKR